VSLFVRVAFVSVGALLPPFLLNIKIHSSPACSRTKNFSVQFIFDFENCMNNCLDLLCSFAIC